MTITGIKHSHIIKRLLYEFIFKFTPLFYIAYVKFNIDDLKMQMLTLFAMDEIRRIITETLLPQVQSMLF
jgi:anoctamin-10